MKKFLLLLSLCVWALPGQAKVLPGALPVISFNDKTQTEALEEAVKEQDAVLRESLKLDGCRPLWADFTRQMQTLPQLAAQACEAFQEVGGDCAQLGAYVFRQAERDIAGRKGALLLAGYRQGFITEEESVKLVTDMQNHLILGIMPAIVTFLPQAYWVDSCGQLYDFAVSVNVTNGKMYDYVCARSLPVIENILQDIIENKEFIHPDL